MKTARLHIGTPQRRKVQLSFVTLLLVALMLAFGSGSQVQLSLSSVDQVHAQIAQAPASSALSFNGSNYVQVADNASLRILINLTLEAWIKPTRASGHQHFVGKNNYELSTKPSGTGFKVLFEFASAGSWRSVTSGQLPLNQGYHVAGTYDGSTMRLFVNGTQVASRATTGNIDQTSNPLRIASADGSSDFFIGTIDEVRISDVVHHTGNFNISRSPFASDANTKGL
jgi:hypothetical protein